MVEGFDAHARTSPTSLILLIPINNALEEWMRCTKSVFTFLTLFAALTLSTAGLAQTLTGNITVRAQDASGAVIPGVEVSA